LSVGARVLGAIVNDAPRKKGYETYGGSYYGGADVAYAHKPAPATRRLSAPRAVRDDDDRQDDNDDQANQNQQDRQPPRRRRDIA
jgi:hypothetical protein